MKRFMTQNFTPSDSMAVERYATKYNMANKNRGLALIFNHEKFDNQSLGPRTGTNADSDGLCKALKQLDFKVNVYKDCKLEEIKNTLKTDHSKNDCSLVAILSHGDLGYICAKDVQYKLDSTSHYFDAHTCHTLAGKPKLFFIQTCQRGRRDPGVQLQNIETDGVSSMSYEIPVHADFLYAYSTISGFVAWRDRNKGSWFIQSLVEELNENGKKYDILTLLTSVIQRVALDFETYDSENPKNHQKKQIPCFTSTLTRILRFNDKNSKGD